MEKLNINHIATIISAIFYKYNYIDFRMWTQMKNQLDYKELNNNTILVSIEQLREFMILNYANEVNKLTIEGSSVPVKEATSVYFMHRVCVEMQNLKYIKIELNSDKAYTRMVKVEEESHIKYDFSIVKGVINLAKLFPQNELDILNPLLCDVGLLKEDIPYSNYPSHEILTRLDKYVLLENDNKAKGTELVLALMDTIETIVEQDNPKLLIITDY
mgnify:CR=1 FL=1